MKLGVIGTNWISKSFVDAAIKTKKYTFQAIYSRSQEKAHTFLKDFESGIAYTDFEKFILDDQIEIVYVASPNSVHFQQCMKLIQSGKHVIVEKPACSNFHENRLMFKEARKKGVFLFEAARHIHEKNFKILKTYVYSIGKIRNASFSYMKYSSRYNDVLSGGSPNIFSLDYSGGALYDLGIYLIYAAIDIFGMPNKYLKWQHFF